MAQCAAGMSDSVFIGVENCEDLRILRSRFRERLANGARLLPCNVTSSSPGSRRSRLLNHLFGRKGDGQPTLRDFRLRAGFRFQDAPQVEGHRGQIDIEAII
jgi:hypothetical protein